MKIREGFVSNSSSASYIVKIHTSWEDFSTIIKDEIYWSFCDVNSLKTEIQNSITREKEFLNKGKVTSNKEATLFEPLLEYWEEALAKHEETLKELDKEMTPEDMIKWVLKYYGMGFIEKPDMIELSGFTSMHNSYVEGMQDLLKEIVLCFLARGKKVELTAERD